MNANESNLLGMWQVLPAAESGAVSFDLPAGTSEAEPAASLWRLDLPAGEDAAQGRLGQIEAQAQASTAALDILPGRLEALLALAQSGQAVSFAAAAPDLASAEAELLRLLDEVQSREAAVSFDVEEAPPSGWQQARQAFEETTRRLFYAISHLAWVETSQGGRLLGRTTLGWAGDVDTIYRIETSPEQAALHQRSLAAAVQTRHTVLRTFIFTAQGAAKLAALFSTPGGALLALPAVWKYANQVLAEINPG